MPRKRKPRAEVAPQEDIFAALARHGANNFQVGPDPEPAKKTEPAAGGDVAALLARIDRLQNDFSDLQRRTYLAPAQPRTEPVRQGLQARDVTLDLSNLPDPGLDINAYNRELQLRINAVVAARTQAARDDAIQTRAAAENETTQATRLMNGFLTAHPEWAGREKLIDMVAKEIVEREAAKGVAVDRYVFGDPSLFYTDVAKALEKDYANLLPEGDEDDDEGDEPGPSPVGRADPGPFADDGRTAGIMGGQDSGGKPTRGRQQPVADNPNSMIKDLQDLQLKSGYY